MTVASQVKQCLASMKNIRSGLETFALQSEDAHAQRELHEATLQCDKVINDLTKRIGDLEREEPQYKGF